MGDRANIQIKEQEGGTLYLYTHWGGSELPEVLAEALAAGRERWGDEAYLSRIIFSHLIKDNVLGETGYGLTTYRTDFEYPDLIVDMANQFVTDRNGVGYSFEDYVNRVAAGS